MRDYVVHLSECLKKEAELGTKKEALRRQNFLITQAGNLLDRQLSAASDQRGSSPLVQIGRKRRRTTDSHPEEHPSRVLASEGAMNPR